MSSAPIPRLFRSSLLMVAVVLIMLGGVVALHRTATATGSMPITGYAWSQNAGWISFNGSLYGVSEDKTTGALSGYAWSSNIGWITFNAGEVAGCPSGTCAPTVDLNGATGKVSGWARACAAFADKNACSGALDGNSGGWDGWIALSGIAADSSTYGMVQGPTCAWTGYAWGSNTIGAISASGIAADSSPYGVTGNDPTTCAGVCANGANNPPTCTTFTPCANGANNPPACTVFPPVATLSATAFTIDQGQSATLTWSSTNATSCTGTGFTANGTSGSVSTGALNTPGTYNYQVICHGPSGDSLPAFTSVEVLAPNVTISAIPTRVKTGDTSRISWGADGVTSCAVTSSFGKDLAHGNADHSHNFRNASSNEVITTQTTFTIDCKTSGPDIIKSVTVNVLSGFQEF